MEKRSRLLLIVMLGINFIIAAIQTVIAIYDNNGIQSAGGDVSLNVFYNQQILQDGNMALMVLMLILLALLGSIMFILIKNNNELNFAVLCIGYKEFLKKGLLATFGWAALANLTNQIIMLFILYFGFAPIDFSVPLNMDIGHQWLLPVLRSNLAELIAYLLTSSIGMGIFASLVFSIGLFINKTGIYIAAPIILILLDYLLVYVIFPVNKLVMIIDHVLFLSDLFTPGLTNFYGKYNPLGSLLSWAVSSIFWCVIIYLLSRLWVKRQLKEG